MSGAVLSLRRSHYDHVRRSAAWLVALAIFVQCVFGSAATLRMWAGDLDPLGAAPALCIDQGAGTKTPDRQDQGPSAERIQYPGTGSIMTGSVAP